MTIETAQFVVQRAGVQLKCTGADLATKLQADDLMAVTRPGDGTYKWVRPITPVDYKFTVNVEDKEFYIGTQTESEYNTYDTTVDWGDSNVETIKTPYNTTHRYLENGIYNIKITIKEGAPFSLYGSSTNDQYKWVSIDKVDVKWNWGSSLLESWQSCRELTSFPLINTSTVNNFEKAWQGCSNLTSFPSLDYSSALDMSDTWSGCSSLTSMDYVDAPLCTDFNSTWKNCTLLTSFAGVNSINGEGFWQTFWGCSSLETLPAMDTSNAVGIYGMFYGCSKLKTIGGVLNTDNVTEFGNFMSGCRDLTSVPITSTSNGINFTNAWNTCSSITSFPAFTFNSGTTFDYAWNSCSQLSDFPPNAFDVTGVLGPNCFMTSFQGCALSPTSIENILVSIDVNGTENNIIYVSTGTNAPKSTWTAAANTAYDNLITKGWTITFNP